MKSKVYFITPFIILVLISCISERSVGIRSVLPSASNSEITMSSKTQTLSPVVHPTSTIQPELLKSLKGAAEILPPYGQPLYSYAWFGNADGKYWRSVYLPYRVQDGLSLQLSGQPAHKAGRQREMQGRIWDWQDTNLEPDLWQEIRPVGDQSSFFGRDQDGQWWVVMGRVNWDVPEYVLLGVVRVASLDDIPIEKLGIFPTKELNDLQIEKIDLSPVEENVQQIEHFVIREENKLILYQMENGQARKIWSTDKVMPGRFHVYSYSESDRSIDMTGDNREEILIVWDESFPRLVDIYQFIDNGPEIFRWLGRVESTWQYLDVNGDGIAEFLQPDDPDKLQKWQVIRWNGSMFANSEILLQPQQIGPSPIPIVSLEELPVLPYNLIFKDGSDHQWRRLSQENASPEVISPPKNLFFAPCATPIYGGYGEACYSPAGRFKMIDVTPYIEGRLAGVLDGLTGNSVTIPGSFVYTQGYNTFAWSPDEKFLLFARGEGIGRLEKIDPVSGASQTVWNSSLCGLDVLPCTHFGNALAITDPIVFEDGDFGFVFQSAYPALYPPPGIYRLSSAGELSMLAALPFIDDTKGKLDSVNSVVNLLGHLIWSPDKSTFLYYDLFVGDKNGVRALLLGKADGSVVWDLRNVLPDAQEFYWEK